MNYTWPTHLWAFCLVASMWMHDLLTALIVLLLAPLAMWYEQKLYEKSRTLPNK